MSVTFRRAMHEALAAAIGESDLERRAWHLALAAVAPDDDAAEALALAAAALREPSTPRRCCGRIRACRGARVGRARRQALTLDAAEAAWTSGAPARALGLAEALLDEELDRELRARALQIAGRVEFQVGVTEQALERLLAALELCGENEPDRAATIVYFACLALWVQGRIDEQIALARRGVELAAGGTRPDRDRSVHARPGADDGRPVAEAELAACRPRDVPPPRRPRGRQPRSVGPRSACSWSAASPRQRSSPSAHSRMPAAWGRCRRLGQMTLPESAPTGLGPRRGPRRGRRRAGRSDRAGGDRGRDGARARPHRRRPWGCGDVLCPGRKIGPAGRAVGQRLRRLRGSLGTWPGRARRRSARRRRRRAQQRARTGRPRQPCSRSSSHRSPTSSRRSFGWAAPTRPRRCSTRWAERGATGATPGRRRSLAACRALLADDETSRRSSTRRSALHERSGSLISRRGRVLRLRRTVAARRPPASLAREDFGRRTRSSQTLQCDVLGRAREPGAARLGRAPAVGERHRETS